MTEILWRKCSEVMPSDDEKEFIIDSEGDHFILEGYMIHRSIINPLDSNIKWIPYDKEIWNDMFK